MHQIPLGFYLKKHVISSKKERQVSCIVTKSCVIAIGLGYDFLEHMQQNIHVCNLIIA